MRRIARNANKRRTLTQLIRRALRGEGHEANWTATMELQMRGCPRTLELARTLSRSPSWRRRSLGLYVASQLRQCQRGEMLSSIEYALEETQALLLHGLHDPHDEVVRAAVSGMGHRAHPAALPDLLRLATHRDPHLRWNVAVTLGRYRDPEAVAALLTLARDSDDDVRDWATFGLGTMHESDTPEIRDLLWENLRDHDVDVRGEALVGLAERGDTRILSYLNEHLDMACRVYELEAAEKMASPLLLDRLHRLLASVDEADVNSYWLSHLTSALAACSPAAVPWPDEPSPSTASST